MTENGNASAQIHLHLTVGAELLRSTAAAAPLLNTMSEVLISCLKSGHKILLCGNGGSAADALHIATELVARYKVARKSLAAIALGSDVAFLTAASNDGNFSDVFVRQIEGLGQAGDVLWAFSTSGNSRNVIRAAQYAHQLGLTVLGFSGATGGKLRRASDLCLRVPSTETPHIQEAHIAAAHAVCDVIEHAFL